jgi:hypothetical protein
MPAFVNSVISTACPSMRPDNDDPCRSRIFAEHFCKRVSISLPHITFPLRAIGTQLQKFIHCSADPTENALIYREMQAGGGAPAGLVLRNLHK